MKFAHLGDCHLGGWRQPELKQLNLECFQEAIRRCIKEEVDFILIAGDLFDSPYPPIETLKETFNEFKKIKEANIPVYLIAGSHDYSVSGKTFLDVLEKAGFCKNVSIFEEKDEKIILSPTIFKNIAIYGYSGKKSGLEVGDIERAKIQDAPGLFKILMLHTTIKDAVKNIPIKSVNEDNLPKADYIALAHLHINYSKGNKTYCGPTFPNNLSELEKLQKGSFYIWENGNIRKEILKTKEVLPLHLEIKNALSVTEQILVLLKQHTVKDKIVILRLSGLLETGKITDINFHKIEEYLKEKEAFIFLKSTSKLHMPEPEFKIDLTSSEDLENQIMERFQERNPSKFNSLIPTLIRSLKVEKLEGETSSSFEDRLLSETKKVIQT